VLLAAAVLLLASPAIPQQRDRDRDRQGQDREQQIEEPQGRAAPATREPGDEAATEEGMPAPQIAPPGRSGQPRVSPYILPLRWRLGVYAVNTDRGVRITQVAPRSAAARAGLEPRDRIVTVGGYQVGYVNGRLYSLGEELQHRANRSGYVALLVQDHRTGNLTNMGIQLQSAGDYRPYQPRRRDDDRAIPPDVPREGRQNRSQ
jgi:hypothetical protein